MKKLLLLCFILPLLSFQNSTQSFNIIGKWIGEDEGQIGYVIFDKEGYAAFEIEGQVMGGKNFELDGEKGEMTYRIDESKNPIEVDLTLKKFSTGEQKIMKCIAKFKDKNTLEFAMGFGEDRPLDFNNDESITLKRIE